MGFLDVVRPDGGQTLGQRGQRSGTALIGPVDDGIGSLVVGFFGWHRFLSYQIPPREQQNRFLFARMTGGTARVY